MAENRCEHRRRVLCVIPTPDNHAHPIVSAVADAGMDVETVGDVYDAMVWLGGGEVDVDAVVVDVAGLESSEMEFFDLAARYHWWMPVYVFGCGSSGVLSAKIDAALLRGARAAVGPDRLVDQLSDHPLRRDDLLSLGRPVVEIELAEPGHIAGCGEEKRHVHIVLVLPPLARLCADREQQMGLGK